jgi:hypothetical protein
MNHKRRAQAWISLIVVAGLATFFLVTPAGAYDTCSSKFPHGVRGTLRTAVTVGFEYQTEHDLQLSEQQCVLAVQSSLSRQAAANPVGLDFDFSGKPVNLYIVIMVAARGKDSTGHAQAYWGDVVRVYGMGLKDTDLFNAPTQAYPPGNGAQILTEASNSIFTYLANGWTCKH